MKSVVFDEIIKEIEWIKVSIGNRSNFKRIGDDDTTAMRFWHKRLNESIIKLKKFMRDNYDRTSGISIKDIGKV